MSDTQVLPITILVIEDDPGDFGLVHAYLQQSGLDLREGKAGVTWVRTLAEGISTALHSKFDIVLLDLSLPDSVGLATIQEMRSALPGLPIVVLTGLDDAIFADIALQMGAQDYLIKGKFEGDTLGRVVRYALVRDELESRLRLFEVAMSSVVNGIVITDIHSKIEWVNPAFTQLTGYPQEEALGRTPGQLIKSGMHNTEFYHEMWETLLSGEAWQGEIVNRRKDGSLYDEELIITPVTGSDGTIQHFVAIMQNITERKQAEVRINRLAFYDALTQLPNRHLLNDRLEQAMAASKRNGRYGAVLFLDMDNFKPLNDNYGHAVGDLLLVKVAQRLGRCIREVDTAARFGGDEFVVILNGLDIDKSLSATQAGVIAEKIRMALAKPYWMKIQREGQEEYTVEHCCTTSIGVKLFFDHQNTSQDVLKWADMAMYQAKDLGRNAVLFHDDPA